MEQAHAVLRDTFGFPGFRHTQEEVCRQATFLCILRGRLTGM